MTHSTHQPANHRRPVPSPFNGSSNPHWGIIFYSWLTRHLWVDLGDSE